MIRLAHLSRSPAGTVSIVTGAASGMGRATAQLLADEGGSVGLVDRDPDGPVDSLANDAGAYGWRA